MSDWSKEEVLKAINDSSSKKDVLDRLGKSPNGGNYNTLDNYIKIHSIDVSHLLKGSSWNRGKNYQTDDRIRDITEKISVPDDQIFVINSLFVAGKNLKKRLIRKGVNDICAVCGQEPLWNGHKLVLQLDHINGDRTDNRVENLRILCPNCHSQTPSYRGKSLKNKGKNCKKCSKSLTFSDPKDVCLDCKHTLEVERQDKPSRTPEKRREKRRKYLCKFCGIPVTSEKERCAACYSKANRKIERPPIEDLRKIVEQEGYQIARKKFGNVSDNTIRKWFKAVGEEPPRKRNSPGTVLRLPCESCGEKTSRTAPPAFCKPCSFKKSQKYKRLDLDQVRFLVENKGWPETLSTLGVNSSATIRYWFITNGEIPPKSKKGPKKFNSVSLLEFL